MKILENIRKDSTKILSDMLHKKGNYKSVMNATAFNSLIPNKDIDWNDIENAFPELVQLMKITPQDPEYHTEGDVWTHTKMVVNELLNSNDYSMCNSIDKEILFWSALFHDIGKPGVSTIDEDTGRITSRGHSKRGMHDVRLMMLVAELDPYIREQVCNIIEVHQYPFSWIRNESIFEIRNVSQHLKLNNLYIMAKSDALGRTTTPSYEKQNVLDNVELFKYACEEQECLDKSWFYDFTSIQARDLYWNSSGSSFEGRPVHPEPGSDVIMLCGLPASGKDTFAATLGHPMLSYDSARDMFGWNDKGNGRAVQYVKEKAKEYLRKKEPFIWNANFLSNQTREKELTLLRNYNANIKIIYFDEFISTLENRNNLRGSTFPTNKILERAYSLEIPKSNYSHEVIWWKNDQYYNREFLTYVKRN